MTLKQWTAEMTKMQKAYGAPITDDEVKLLGVYLASAYGDAKTVTEADAAMTAASLAAATPPAPPAASAAVAVVARTPDVRALLEANGCLACHAADRKVFGPAYQEVAAKYKADPQAVAHVAASIRQGGSGKWGTTPMPSFPALGADDANALAAYVLMQ